MTARPRVQRKGEATPFAYICVQCEAASYCAVTNRRQLIQEPGTNLGLWTVTTCQLPKMSLCIGGCETISLDGNENASYHLHSMRRHVQLYICLCSPKMNHIDMLPQRATGGTATMGPKTLSCKEAPVSRVFPSTICREGSQSQTQSVDPTGHCHVPGHCT